MATLLREYIHTLLLVNNEDWKSKLIREWAQIVGNLHTKMCLEKIEGAVLKIGVYDSHWIHELFMLAPMIVRTINTALGGSYVVSVRFGVKEKKRVVALYDVEQQVVQQPIELTLQQQQMLSNITDNELRLSLEQFLKRCLQKTVL